MLSVTPMERGKIYTKIVEQLEAEILRGNIGVGDSLPSETELTEAFNVGKRSVREALQVLETKGLIVRRHGEKAQVVRNDVGVFVETLTQTVKQFIATDQTALEQLMQVRMIIESQAAGLAAKTSRASDLKNMEDALDMFKEALQNNDTDMLSKSDACFHKGLISALNNDILTFLYDNLQGLLLEEIREAIQVHEKEIVDALGEHQQIYNLIKNGDVEGATKGMIRHLEGSLGFLRKVLKQRRAQIKAES